MSANRELQLIRKLRSPDNKTVVHAIEELRAHGWLENGTLQGIDLKHTHLQGADLYEANLSKADLRMAHLQLANLSKANLEASLLSSANLYGADLSGTSLKDANLFRVNLQSARNVTKEQLASTKSLWGAIMPDGSLYDGRFNLFGDLEFARTGQIDIEDEEAMANFYLGSESLQGIRTEERSTKMNTFTNVQLIRKLRSSKPFIVRQAVDELRDRGCLTDGSLKWVYLRYVKLEGADLSGADLQRADMNMAHMQGADLSNANLQGARLHKVNLRGAQLANANLHEANMAKVNLQGVLDLTDEQLAQANRLRCATMPDGTRYDGRLNLAGDLADAGFLHVNTSDPQAMADFYAISVDQYELGQAWVREHLPLVWSEVFPSMVSVDLQSIVDFDMDA
ncbi:MAG TPA: pentapeptide repeat-containing protein [Anaerolineae bacterium]|nr:pentapeptide repeat-containing protein [Anaerolineae bacterium]